MKSVLLSVRPQYVAKILNGEKTIEIRKKFPSDYVGWVYIYVTQGKGKLVFDYETDQYQIFYENECNCEDNLNGKVVARFWCDKVEEIIYDYGGLYEMFYTGELDCDMLNVGSRLADNELKQYLKPKREHGNICGKAIHITKLEIFDEPKEISEFHKVGYENEKQKIKPNSKLPLFREVALNHIESEYQLTRSPQSWQFIEI